MGGSLMIMRKVIKLCLLLCATALTTTAFSGGLSPVENQIREMVIKQEEAQLTLLEKLVNINSGTMNPQGVQQVGELLRPYFEQLGFKTYWKEEPSSMKRAGTLIAKREGKQGKRLLLISHLDTVFSKNSTFQRFTLGKNTAKGPGVLDDKGGIVIILYALKALHAVHALDQATIIVALIGDEEDSGKPTIISRQPLREVAKECDVALDFEPAMTLNTATIARRGVSQWTITVKGNESHSATIFQKNVGAGAIFELSRILNSMRIQFQYEPNLSFNAGLIMGGTKLEFDKATAQGTVFGKENVIPKQAVAKGDFRFLTSVQKQSFETRLAKIVSHALPGTKSTLEFQAGIPAMPPTVKNMALLKSYSNASKDLGLGVIKPLSPGLRGAGDISHIADLVPANLAGLGPVGMGTHSNIESLELKSLPIQTERAAILIYRLTR